MIDNRLARFRRGSGARRVPSGFTSSDIPEETER